LLVITAVDTNRRIADLESHFQISLMRTFFRNISDDGVRMLSPRPKRKTTARIG